MSPDLRDMVAFQEDTLIVAWFREPPGVNCVVEDRAMFLELLTGMFAARPGTRVSAPAGTTFHPRESQVYSLIGAGISGRGSP
jgi:hypothetical protein